MFSLLHQQAKLVKFVPYVELHGQTPEPGAALRFEFNVPSSTLAGLDPELRAFLYCRAGAKSHDLADETAELPNLRFGKFKPPYYWRQKYDDSLLTIHIGDREDNAIELSGRIKKPFAITPMEGGTCVIGMTYNCHPGGTDVGSLYALQRNEVRISLDPGEEVDDDGDDDKGGEEE